MNGMKVQCSFAEGHLVVAAIRVLAHRHEGRPPTVEEIAELTGISKEWAGVLVASLEQSGIVRSLPGPFETRVEVREYLALEKLPRENSAARVDDELREFAQKKKAEEEKLRDLFATGDALNKQQKKLSKLEEDLKGWKPRKPPSSPLFRDPGDDS
jgi:DNA-binding MarR family transcriptional regulator